jgi:hypothetical protein
VNSAYKIRGMLDTYHARAFLTMRLAGETASDISEPTIPPSLWHQMGGDVPAELQAGLAFLAA